MRLLMFLPWRLLYALAITAVFLTAAYHLSERAGRQVDRMFLWPIQRMIRSAW